MLEGLFINDTPSCIAGRGAFRLVGCATRRAATSLPALLQSLLPCLLGFVCVLCSMLQGAGASAQQPVEIWEFSPYEVEVWCALDPGLEVSELAQSQFPKALADDLERMFGAAWRVRVTLPDAELRTRLSRSLETIELTDFTREELILVINRDPANAAVRTLETAVEKLGEFAILPEHKAKIDAAVAKVSLDPESAISGMLAKLKVTEGGLAAIATGLESKSISAALLPRSMFDKPLEKFARQIQMLLPWQTDSLLRERDKIFLLHVGRDANGYVTKTRELDCSLQYFGPSVQRESPSWSYLNRTATAAIATAFAPIARVENATAKTAELRLKAGGLILSQDNPANVLLGDLMHPLVRREGSNGATNSVEPLPWTYAAITGTDGVKLNANVYAYSGGPGLQGKNNRRTQRFVLRVRPLYPQTDIQIAVRATGKPQAGCAVYDRDIETEQFSLMGKTDWRGRFTVPRPNRNVMILPEAIRAQKEAADKKAKAAADAAAQAVAAAAPGEDPDADSTASEATASDTAASGKPAEAPEAATATTEAAKPPVLFSTEGKTIALRQPLVQLYVKSGDVVLARLPVVPGISPLEKAELADDSRRLEAEAFMRGFQGEILDLIGLRTLLSTRINRLLAQNKMKDAEKVLVELRSLKDYSAMVEGLDRLQRKVLDESTGPISLGAKSRIDRLFQTTREMMQKFLQNDLVRDAESAFMNRASAGDSAGMDPSATGGANAANNSGSIECTFAGFQFTLPSRFEAREAPLVPGAPPGFEVKVWACETPPTASFSCSKTVEPKRTTLDKETIKAPVNNFFAGFTRSSGIKVSNRSDLQALQLAGTDFYQFEWSGTLADKVAYGLVYATSRGDSLMVFSHIGVEGDQQAIHAEIRKHLATLRLSN